MHQTILIYDFGSQYTQLIARRIREMNVYCEIHPWTSIGDTTPDCMGVILSGSPYSVRDSASPKPDLSHIKGKLPLLGICYGAQLLAQGYGGEVKASNTREYGRANLNFIKSNELFFEGVAEDSQVWMSHSDTVKELPTNGVLLASTADVTNAAYKIEGETTFAIQFHPEVYHSTDGMALLKNFVLTECGCHGDWSPGIFVEEKVAELKAQIGSDHVILGLSGGVDSSVAAMLLHKAIGTQLHCIFVDNGLLRKGEYQQVLDSYKHMGLNIKGVDASSRFYDALSGKTDPEAKRKAIGKVFIDVFDEESKLVSTEIRRIRTIPLFIELEREIFSDLASGFKFEASSIF